jgi:Flp pilus assembly protein TadG
MHPPFIQRPGSKIAGRNRERGVTLALVAIGIVSVIAMAALSIDVGTLYEANAEAQRAADAAALAAARVLSASGLTGDPGNSSGTWSTICTMATQTATAVANQNLVGGAAPSNVSVSFISGDQQSDCTASGTPVSFGWNPTVTVQVKQATLSTYFARIWGRTGNSVSATATAEAFNPSNSSGTLPVQPRCVKPWVVPNYEPWVNGNNCTTANCTHFVDAKTGDIQSPGVANDTKDAVIGQKFDLVPACKFKNSTCVLGRSGGPLQPVPNVSGGQHIPFKPNLEYLPGSVPATSSAVPAAAGACSGLSGQYADAIAGCDQSTQYQCGVQNANSVDLSENPGPQDTTSGVECLIHQGGGNGPDSLNINGALTPAAPFYPFQILAGTNNPVVLAGGAASGDVVTSSNSIVSLPIYDSSQPGLIFTSGNTTNVTIIGFLQVFINKVDNFGNVTVTVMNVSGCGNNASGTALTGTSPVPVRLITPP